VDLQDSVRTPSPFLGKGFSIRRAVPSAALALLIGGCAAGAPLPATPTAPAESPSGRPDYPVTLVDDEGTEVTLPADPGRIVSFTPAVTETLFALGEGDSLVGGTDFDDYPPEAAALPDVATFEGVLVEKVVDLDPELAIAGGNDFTPPDDVARLRQLGIPVLVVYAETVDEVIADIELVGEAAGARRAAEELTTAMEARIEDVRTAAATTTDRPRVFYEIGDQPEIYGPADDSFVADMIELAGGDPITTGDPSAYSISLERLVAEDPEVIVLGDANYGVTPDAVAARPGGWREMTAVREGAVRPIDDIIVTRPGPRFAEGLALLAETIHPELDLGVRVPPSPSANASASAVPSSP
jgi:iron complex transport system substrate-binding protein